MKVKLAKTAGFCMGVRRAMNIVLDTANKTEGKIYTYGPLVHNPQAVEMLRHKGVEILSDSASSDATVNLMGGTYYANQVSGTITVLNAYGGTIDFTSNASSPKGFRLI